MADTSDQPYTLWRVVRPHVDTSGTRPGNTATQLMRWAFQQMRTGDNVMIHTGVHDGDKTEMEVFYLVPQRLMRRILADAGIDPAGIPSWSSNSNAHP